MLMSSSPSTEGLVFITHCVAPDRGMWRTACNCTGCVHAKCLKCGFEWRARPDPLTCPKCHHVYVKWVNFDEHRKTHARVAQ